MDVLHKHDLSFELDELDQKMMKLDMNGTNSDSPGAVSLSLEYEDVYESTENSSAVVYIESVHGDDQLIASESSDVPASNTEVTYDSDLMSVLDNSKSETSDNESNQSSEVVPPSVFEYDGDNMIQLDESGNSSIISYQMARSHAVEPAKDSVQSLSDGEVSPSGNVNSVPHAVEPAKDSVQTLIDGEVFPSGNVNSVPHAVEPAKDSVQSLSDGEVSPSGNVNSVPHAVEPAKDSVQSLSDGEVSPSGNVNSVPHAVEPAKDSVQSLSDGEVSPLENVNSVPHAVEPAKDSVQSDGEVSPLENVNSVPHAVEPANEIDKSSNPEKFPPVAEMNVNRQTCEEETEQVSSSEDDFSHEELEMKLMLMSLPDVIRKLKPTYMDGQKVMNPYQKQDEEECDTEPYADSDSVPGEVTETGQDDADADPNKDSDSVPDEVKKSGQDDADADPNKDSDSVPDEVKKSGQDDVDADPNKDSNSVPDVVMETGQGDVDADPNKDNDSVPDEVKKLGQDDVDADPNKDSDSVPDHGKIDKVVTDVDLDGNRKIKKEDGNVEGGTKKRSRKGAKEANTKRRESTRLKRKKEEESETDDSKKQKIDVPKIEEDDNDNGRKKTNTSRGHKTTRKTELKHDEDKNVVHKVPIDWICDTQTKPPMSKETQKHPLMQAIYKRNPVPTNTDGNRSVCELCNKSFAHKRSLTGHLKLHYQTGKYNCTQCGRNFVNKNEYE